MAVALGAGTDTDQRVGEARVAAGAGVGAEVEVRQVAVEQAGDEGADGVGVEQQRIAELALQPRQLLGDAPVVRRPDAVQVTGALLGRRLAPRPEQRLAVEHHVGEQAGGGGGVERRVVRRAVEVDDVARVARRQGRGPQLGSEVVEQRDVPVGVDQRARGIAQAGLHRRGQAGAGVRHADQQRHAAGGEVEDVIQGRSPVRGAPPGWARCRRANRPAPPGAGCPRRRSRRACPLPGCRSARPGPGRGRR